MEDEDPGSRRRRPTDLTAPQLPRVDSAMMLKTTGKCLIRVTNPSETNLVLITTTTESVDSKGNPVYIDCFSFSPIR